MEAAFWFSLIFFPLCAKSLEVENRDPKMLAVTVSPELTEDRMYDITLANRTDAEIDVVCFFSPGGPYTCTEIHPRQSTPLKLASS